MEASNGKVAESLYRDNSSELVISEIIMSEKDGSKTIMEFRMDYLDVKIIAMTEGVVQNQNPI